MKKANNINNPRIKLFGLYLFHIAKRRYMGVFLDPILACNLRCKMCYFSDNEKRKELKGMIKREAIEKIADALFNRALKVQIGCGAEPTLYKDLAYIVSLAKDRNVPFVSITTNGNLLNERSVEELVVAGLDEITLSMHGVTKDTYEYFMPNGDYEKFCSVLSLLSKIKEKYPLKVRINYTINKDNLDELALFFDIFGDIGVDVLQLRPIENIGNSEYADFDHSALVERYEKTILKVKNEAIRKGVLCIAPSKEQILLPEGKNENAILFDYTYCYVSPKVCWRTDFNYETDTFESYSKQHKLSRELFLNIFRSTAKMTKRKKMLNYELD